VCGTKTPYAFCGSACYNGYKDGSYQRELYEPEEGLSTADLIRKWHSEGESPEEIAQVLCRDIKVIREVLGIAEKKRTASREQMRRYRENHREEYNAYHLAYYYKNKDELRPKRSAYMREYYRRKKNAKSNSDPAVNADLSNTGSGV
jgi:hypothetical protein